MSNEEKTSTRESLRGKSFAFFGDFSIWPSYHRGDPANVARQRGATIADTVDETLDYLVLGDKRGTGRSEAKKQAEKLQAKSRQAEAKGKTLRCPRILDEGEFRELVRIDLSNKSFAFFGGFDCCGGELDEALLTRLVKTVGGTMISEVDETLNYFILGNRRGPGKIAAHNKVQKLQASGSSIKTLTEDAFLELVRTDQPTIGGASGMDFATFIGQLYGTVDQGKLGRALKMLKSEAFKLYVNRTDERVIGVVRSQRGVGVYASWLTAEGRYGCATPELQECMGLQGGTCKHLLVLLLGLTRTGDMVPETAYAWLRDAQGKRPKNDIQLAAETFIQYKGCEVGEIDWRPTETIPEDFYAF